MPIDKSMPVLVVDDYPSMRRIACNLLRQLGFTEIDEANDGAEALTKLRQKSFGLVISDWDMQTVDGIELVKQMRADALLAAIPFILVTAESRPESAAIAKQAGVSGYIVKPFDVNTLKSKLTSILGQF
jgi:two-component system, chemotaxis family, chemotaxis protein CheY